jgi:hypothetical protein
MTRAETAAVAAAVVAAACGTAILAVALVHDAYLVLLVLLIYNVLVVAGLAGIVLAAHTARRALATGIVDGRLAVADGLLAPGLLSAGWIAWHGTSVAGRASLRLAVIGLLAVAASLAAWLAAYLSAGRAARRGSRGRSASGSPRSPGTPS